MTTIVLWVEDISAAADFYSALLGGENKDASDAFVNVVAGQHSVLLHKVPAEYATGIATPPAIREDAVLKPVFAVASIADARAAVVHTTGKIYGAETEQTYGGVSYCDGFDVEGNVIQLAQRL